MIAQNEFHSGNLPGPLREFGAEWGIVLGSGLGGFVAELKMLGGVDYADVPGLPVSTVPGHAGRFACVEIEGCRVLVARGRAHLYEGYSAIQVAAFVRCMAAAGVSKLVLTNAAGAIQEGFEPGSWMMIEDHLNLTGTSPLIGGANFFDMSEVYSKALRGRFAEGAAKEQIGLHRGIYAGLTGPQYETPAEVRMLKRLGADAVGMSTVIEAIQARALGVETVGFSFLSNRAAGLGGETLDHSEVLSMAKSGAADFLRLVRAVLRGPCRSRECAWSA